MVFLQGGGQNLKYDTVLRTTTTTILIQRPFFRTTRVNRCEILVELRMMEVVVTAVATRRTKLQSSHHQ